MTQFALPIGTGTAALTIGGRSFTAAVVADFYPVEATRQATTLRMNTLDMAALGTADTITVSNVSAGRLVDRGDQTFDLDLTEVADTSDITFDYVATKSAVPVSGVCRVTLLPSKQEQSPSPGLHWTFPTDVNNRYIFEPGREHRKVYVSPTGITLAEIQAEVPGATGLGPFMRDNIVPPALGGNGVWKYGEAPEVALSLNQARILWNTITARGLTGTSNWLLFERGGDYSTFEWSISGARGESALHPIVVAGYGTGADPILGKLQVGEGFQYLAFQDIALSKNLGAGELSHLIIDGLSAGRGASELSPTHTHMSRGWVLRRMNMTDALKEPKVGDLYHSEKSQRASHVFANGGEGMLVEYCFTDIAGWEEGYPTLPYGQSTLYPVADPQPPSFFSHCYYLGIGSYIVNKVLIDNALGTRWARFRRNIISQGALTGIQFRPGGEVMDCVVIGNNVGLFFAAGQVGTATIGVDGIQSGTPGIAYRNLITWAGQRTGYSDMYRGRAFDISSADAVLVDNLVVNAGPPNDGVYAWGSAQLSSEAVTLSFDEESNDPTNVGTVRYDNTIVRNWINSADDKNLEGVDLVTLDARSMATWATLKTGVTKNYNRDAAEYLRTVDDPWELIPEIYNYFGTPAGRTMDARGVAIAAVFKPDARNVTAGIHWDKPIDWDVGEVPGTVAGDSADLSGHLVTCCDSPVLTSLHLRGGIYRSAGGRLTTGTIASGGRVELLDAGQVFTDGITASDLLAVDMLDGRFVNTGTIAGNLDVVVKNSAEAILGYDSAACTIATGRKLEIHGNRCRVGFDGAAGGAATLTINGAVQAKATLRIFFRDNFEDPALKKRKQWVVGRTVTGGTSGAAGTVVNYGGCSVSAAGVAQAGTKTLDVGFIDVADWTGDFVADEPLLHVGMRGYRAYLAPVQIALAHRFEINSPLPLDSTGRGMIEEFRSGINGTTAPNVASSLVLGGASTFTADLRGLAPGVYCVARADTITGTFASVTITGGTGSIAYTATQVILTVTA